MRKIVPILIILLVSWSTLAQEKKGDKLAASHLYKDAIVAYEKSIAKKPSGAVYQKLGKLYKITKDYHKSKDCYEKAKEDNDLDVTKYMDYAQALMAINQPAEAKQYFQKYADEMQGDPRAELYIISCEEIIKWNQEKPAWEIETVAGVNTAASEFGAHTYLNGLIYTTTGTTDWVDYSEYEALHNNFYDIYYAKSNGSETSFGKPRLLSPKLMSEYHDGPVAITPDGKTIYFCRLDRSMKSERMHLYYAEIKDGAIQKPEPFNYNNDEYSIMHPTFSDDGKVMFFASDKSSALGGFDLFFCKKTRRYGWTAPRPVPGLVNTAGNELFPHYHNGHLYFASDGHFGYGGLDIFVCSEKEQFKVITNLKAPINSSYDDFSYFAIDDKTGYFASNREGGMGDDDIYYFNHLEEIIEDEYPTMTGVFEYKKLKKSNVELVLYDEDGVEIARTKTDEQGNFEFRNLKTGSNFKILAVGDYDESDVYITNANGEKLILMTNANGDGFKFKPLKYTETERMLPIEEEYPTFLTIPVGGFVYRKLEGDLNNRYEVSIYDDNGRLMARTYTNIDGSFDFKTLPPTAMYTIKVGTEEDVQISIRNNRGEDYDEPEKVSESEFIFRRLKADANTFKIVNEENVILEIRQKERFNLPSIYYDYNSTAINAASAEQLDKLYILLRKNSHIKVIFESHTDSRGKDSYNLKLSEKRSESAVKYLIKKGIAKNQIEAVGYGETRLLNKCGNDANCTEEEHAMNRRTEISITGKKIVF